jgi:formate hydrogenlyase subunit 4
LSSRTPFDIAEAEPELASGIYIELSGPLLAFTLYSLYIRRYMMMQILAYVVVEAFIVYPALQLLLTIVLVPILWLVFTVISVVLARTRIDVGPRTLFKVMLVLLLISILLFIFQELVHQMYAVR